MNLPTAEQLEPRLLLSAGVLAAGQAQLFDFDGDGSDDAVLVNTGCSPIEYEHTGGVGLDRVDITADGGAFVTNTYVAHIGDTSATEDFLLGTVKVGVRVCYRGHRLQPIAGATSVDAGAIRRLKVGEGDVLWAGTSAGDIDNLILCHGDLYDVYAQGGLGTVVVGGDVLGSVFVNDGIGRLAAEDIDGASIIADTGRIGRLVADTITNYAYVDAVGMDKVLVGSITGGATLNVEQDLGRLNVGTIESATIIVGQDVDKMYVDTLSGSADGTTVSIGGYLQRLRANTITGGANGTLALTVGAGAGRICVGLLEGGQADAGGFASADVSIVGDVQNLCAGLITGGVSDGAGSLAMLNLSVSGDLLKLRASGLSGGESSNDGDAMALVNIGNDLLDARIGHIVGSGVVEACADPSVYLTVGHDIVLLAAGEISAGTATGDYAYASVWIEAYNDIAKITAGEIGGGSAEGDYSLTEVWILAGRDINFIGARRIHGGSASGEGALAGVHVKAGRNIDVICAGRISGTESVAYVDPTVQFIAGGDIGLVMAGRITGGQVAGAGAASSVLLEAQGVWAGTSGNIEQICAGTIDGGSADGAGALSYVKIHAANDITTLYADRISGGMATDGGYTYVSILAENDIVDFQAGTVIGSQSNDGDETSTSAVQIQAYNSIRSFIARRLVAGSDGTVNILAGVFDESGDLVGGTIEEMIVRHITGRGGVLNIAAGEDIEQLTACRIVSGNGEVNIVAGGDMTVDVRRVRSWTLQDETGVEFQAGGTVNDVRDSIRQEYISEGGEVEFPAPIDEAA